ncbi:hypothetical protein K469DRAFT_683960 [Zopfia rhizophila CBS 207.26]|uniref:GH16 domain-containing protein n=1 Tax=Zopfia rhizophila CBS 207.26 TaxID=1314779 RepID=A0A6A6D8K0_9PEZI|nr:hypothetical protein K469DRAFT_683960 [Zopfia rhizophila CBS 207.26]
MYLSLLKALLSLLTIGRLVYATPVPDRVDQADRVDDSTVLVPSEYYPQGNPSEYHSRAISVSTTGLPFGFHVRDNSDSNDAADAEAPFKEYVALAEPSDGTGLVKRVEFRMRRVPGWGATWDGHIQEPSNSGWTKATIQGFAYQGYLQVMAEAPNAVTMVSALWIPGQGVWLGTIVHDAGKQVFPQQAPTMAPLLWGQIKDRVITGTTSSKYHAEDMACFAYERYLVNKIGPNQNYPQGAYITSFGRYNTNNAASLKPACSSSSHQINPPCTVTMFAMGIDYLNS